MMTCVVVLFFDLLEMALYLFQVFNRKGICIELGAFIFEKAMTFLSDTMVNLLFDSAIYGNNFIQNLKEATKRVIWSQYVHPE